MVLKRNTPVALFAYRRPHHTAQTLASLAANEESGSTDLYVFVDGARQQPDVEKIDQVVEVVHSCEAFASVTCIRRDRNLGLAQSIITGVSSVLSHHESVIVLEDDMVVSPFFLRYMLDALATYWDDERVASVHGYLYPIDIRVPHPFFIRGADCWGWATWRRAWSLLDLDGRKLAKEIRSSGLSRKFNYAGSIDYLRALRRSGHGASDTWAVRWHASAFIRDMYTLYPHHSLVQNIGLDNSGSNCDPTDEFHAELATAPVEVPLMEVNESVQARESFERFFKSLQESWITRQKNRLMRSILRTHGSS